MKSEQMDARDEELRRTLVATADLTPYARKRVSPKIVVGAIAAFALAGALTGGAVASASTVSYWQLATNAALQGTGQDWASEEDGTILGTPIVRAASGTTIIQLGKAPAGANTVATAFACTDRGEYSFHLDAKSIGSEECTDSANGDSSGGTGDIFAATGDHTFTVSAPVGSRYTIWLSWAHIPHLTPSAQQTAELSDGIITHAEDTAAFERYSVCMAALGHWIGNPADSEYTITPSYAVQDSAVTSGADNRCYVTQYQDVDVAWQTEVENGTQASRSVRECLINSGVTPASTVNDEMDQFNALGRDWQDCNYLG